MLWRIGKTWEEDEHELVVKWLEVGLDHIHLNFTTFIGYIHLGGFCLSADEVQLQRIHT